MREHSNELKNYNFYEEFRKDYYVDAYDEHKWKVGRIRNISKYTMRTTIQVHFDGYSVRFDEVPPFPIQNYDLPSSHKLAPLRTFTLPYTGHPELEPKRDEADISKPNHLFKEVARLQKFEKALPTKAKPMPSTSSSEANSSSQPTTTAPSETSSSGKTSRKL